MNFAFRASEMVLKWGVLQGSEMSHDVSVARGACEVTERKSNSSVVDVELGSFTVNPLSIGSKTEGSTYHGSSGESSNRTDADDTQRLLTSIQERVQQQEERSNAFEGLVRQHLLMSAL